MLKKKMPRVPWVGEAWGGREWGVGQEGKVGGFDADLLCAAVRRASELKLERTAQAAAVKEAELNEEQEKLKSSMGITKLRLLRGAAAAAGGKAHHHAQR